MTIYSQRQSQTLAFSLGGNPQDQILCSTTLFLYGSSLLKSESPAVKTPSQKLEKDKWPTLESPPTSK